MAKLGPLDYVAFTALSSVAGWAYMCTKGQRSAMISTGVFVSLYGILYMVAPSRRFPTGEDVTEGIDLTGRIAIVTGATSGIGIDTARVLALRGAHVYLAARNEQKLKDTKDQLVQQVQQGLVNSGKTQLRVQIDTLVCDLNDLESVRSCASAFLKKHDTLNILINNAGIMALPKRSETKQGLESQVGVCHVAHFYLTKLLLPALQRAKGGDGRVVCLSSTGHRSHEFDKCLESEQLDTDPYEGWKAYGNAKVANILHAKALANKEGNKVKAYSVMPGGIMTSLQVHVAWWVWIKYMIANPLFFKTTNQGAATTLVCATHTANASKSSIVAPQLGEYHDNCKPVPSILKSVLKQLGEDAPERTWDATEKLLEQLGFS
eukprot:scaffold302_cov106-Cylindrotheca_fusiformis.AAC.2